MAELISTLETPDWHDKQGSSRHCTCHSDLSALPMIYHCRHLTKRIIFIMAAEHRCQVVDCWTTQDCLWPPEIFLWRPASHFFSLLMVNSKKNYMEVSCIDPSRTKVEVSHSISRGSIAFLWNRVVFRFREFAFKLWPLTASYLAFPNGFRFEFSLRLLLVPMLWLRSSNTDRAFYMLDKINSPMSNWAN
jgi:hypothetical protein